MDDRAKLVRLAIYRAFARTGRAPAIDDLSAELGLETGDIDEALTRLEAMHALALAPTTRNVWMAHPFSAVPTPYSVVSATVTYWANCAWDAFAIPPLLGLDASISARCPDCFEELFFRFEAGKLVASGDADEDESVVHLAVPPKRFWENVGFT